MLIDNLLVLSRFLHLLPEERFTVETWVTAPSPVEDIAEELPEGSKACPVGWLPAAAPQDWCWLHVEDQIVPCLKTSRLWEGNPLPRTCRHQDHLDLATTTIWRQVGEWLELDHAWLTQVLFGADFYRDQEVTPRRVAERLDCVVQWCQEEPQWEQDIPEHYRELRPFLAQRGMVALA